MPKSVFSQALVASSKSSNVLAGDINEFIPYDAVVRVASVTSAATANISIYADSDILTDDKPIPYVGTTLLDSDHKIDEFAVEAGTRLAIFYRETGAGTPTVKTAVEIVPV